MKRVSEAARPYVQAFYRGNRFYHTAALTMLILGTPIDLVYSWMLGEVLDIIAAGSMERLWWMLRFALIFSAGVSVLELLMQRCKSRFIHRALTQYKNLAFSRLSEKSISAFSRENTGRYLSVLTNDSNSLEENYLNRSLLLVYQCLLFGAALAMMFWYSWKLASATLLLSMLPLAVSFTMGGELSRREKVVSDQNERFVAQIKDLLGGFSVIKSFKAEREAQALFDRENRETERAKEKRRWWDGLLGTISGIFCGAMVQFGIFIFGAWLVIRGEITAGTVLIIVNLCNFILEPIKVVPQYWAGRKAAVALVEKLAAIMEENTEQRGEAIPPVLTKAIELEDLSYAYEPGKPVLQHVSFRMEAGKCYALVGASGRCKSTLLHLLMGADSSYAGSICIDGRELREVDPNSLYDLMSLIGQNVFLFDDTIWRNITMFRDFPEEQVEKAVKNSGLIQLVSQKGKDYLCGENGVNLSGGERQRVSIACSLLRGGTLCEKGTYQDLMERKGYFYSLYTVSNN